MSKNSKNAKSKNRCVIYARYSCHNQTEQSIEGQMHDCERYAEANGLQIVKTYIDRAMTATSDRRPQFQQMIKDSALGMFDTILVWKLDRFARNRYDSAVYKRQLRSNGVTVVSVMEHITDSPEGVLMESVLEGFAEYFSRDLSQKVVRGMRETAQNHKITGKIPFGYRKSSDGRYEPDPVTAPAVKKVFSMYNRGYKKSEIAGWLCKSGYRTASGASFTQAAVTRILQNERYTGKYTYSGLEIIDETQRIVSDEVFCKVQDVSHAKTNSGRIHRINEKYLLSNKLYCGYCYNRMNGECGKSSTGKTYAYYACVGRKKFHVCIRKNFNKDAIEKIVIDSISRLISDSDIIDRISDAIIKYQNEHDNTGERISVLTNKLNSINYKITNLMSAIENGIVTPTTKQRLIELEQLKLDAENEIVEIRTQRPGFTKAQLVDMIRKIDLGKEMSDHEKYTIVQQLVKKIFAWEDKLLIVYNFAGLPEDESDEELIETYIEKAAAEKRSTTATFGTPNVEVVERLEMLGMYIVMMMHI